MSSRVFLTSGAVLLQMLLSFLFVKIFALFCSYITYKWSQNFCLWSCTLEKILSYPINNFLILCYHSKLLRVMLNIFCSNKNHITKNKTQICTKNLNPDTKTNGLSNKSKMKMLNLTRTKKLQSH